MKEMLATEKQKLELQKLIGSQKDKELELKKMKHEIDAYQASTP